MTGTSLMEDQSFTDHLLEEMREWAMDEFEIHELYGEAEIKEWLEDHAEEYGYTQEE